MEYIAHADIHPNRKATKPEHQQSDVEAPPLTTEASAAAEGATQQTIPESKQAPSTWCIPSTSPAVRGHRLTFATLLLIPLCIAFGFRAADFATHIPYECDGFVKGPLHPNWYAVIPLNIIPFIIGSAAWLRAFVDCLLVRWGKGLGYPSAKADFEWPPLAPLVLVAIIMLLPIVIIVKLLGYGAVALMGRERKDEKDEDINLEEVGLVANVEGAHDEDMDEPPSYESSWREQGNDPTSKDDI